MKTFFLIAASIYLLANAYVFLRGWQALPSSWVWKLTYAVVFVAVVSSFLLSMALRDTLPLGVQKILFPIGAGWLACMLYFVLFFLLTDLVALADRFIHFMPQAVASGTIGFRRWQVGLSSLAILIICVTGYIRFNNPVVETYNLTIHKKAGNLKSLKAVMVSDIHLGITVDKERLAKYVSKINALKPDIILIAGDIIDNNVGPLNEEKMYEELNMLKAPLGVYTVLGNHEYISGEEASLEFFKKTQIKVLIDESVCIDSSFSIIGRDDRSNRRRRPLKSLVAGVNQQQPIILLDHQPYHLEEAEENGIDLQLSGHTHAGQLWPGNLLVEKLYEVGYGYKQKGNTHVYTSSGLALWGPPFRIATQSEMVVFNLSFE